MRPGRNDPCWCGSGKKYKRCHLDPDKDAGLALTEAMPMIQAQIQRGIDYKRRLRDEFALHINFVSPIEWQGGRVWGIGSRVYPGRPPNETFHEFIFGVLAQTLGEPWRAMQEALPDEQQHFVYTCFQRLRAFQARHVDPETLAREGRVSAEVNGWVRYLLSLAWDVATLVHAGEPAPVLIDRLRDRDQYQGARYEIAVAAMFARLDCSIRWLDADPALWNVPHVEFEATHRPTQETVAVEAKSRHRAGVINQPGESGEDPLRGDSRALGRLFRSAVDKAPTDVPYFVFVDINAPSRADDEWQQDAQRWISRRPPGTPEAPDPYTGAYFTNFSPHYDSDQVSIGGGWLEIIPPHPACSPAHDFRPELRQALNAYGRVPSFDIDGSLLN